MIKSLDIVASKRKTILLSEKFQERLGTLIEGYKVEGGILPKCFIFLFLFRIFCYSGVLVVLCEYFLYIFSFIGIVSLLSDV